jgi:hypothetical protein
MSLFGALDGVYQLVRLAALSRFRVRGAYWGWRWHTAFGRGAPASRVELLTAALRYGRWMGRMRRLG